MSYTPRHAKPSPWKRRAASVAAGLGVVASLAAHPGAAEAAPSVAGLSSGIDAFNAQVNEQLSNLGSSNNQAARDAAWNTRNTLRQQADALSVFGPQAPAQAKAGIDQTVEALFPGLIAERTPKPAPAPAPRANPCPADAKACIDLKNQKSWLQNNGQIYHGPVPVSTGRVGYETPRGTFYVNRKVKDEISWEFGNAPMPYSVYFTNNGIAFHEGDPYVMSHGCIHLYHNDAVRYFNDLQYGDKVYVF